MLFSVISLLTEAQNRGLTGYRTKKTKLHAWNNLVWRGQTLAWEQFPYTSNTKQLPSNGLSSFRTADTSDCTK